MIFFFRCGSTIRSLSFSALRRNAPRSSRSHPQPTSTRCSHAPRRPSRGSCIVRIRAAAAISRPPDGGTSRYYVPSLSRRERKPATRDGRPRHRGTDPPCEAPSEPTGSSSGRPARPYRPRAA